MSFTFYEIFLKVNLTNVYLKVSTRMNEKQTGNRKTLICILNYHLPPLHITAWYLAKVERDLYNRRPHFRSNANELRRGVS